MVQHRSLFSSFEHANGVDSFLFLHLNSTNSMNKPFQVIPKLKLNIYRKNSKDDVEKCSPSDVFI